MNIIFLDIDGVLNIMSPTYYSHSYINLGMDPLERHLVKRLEFLLTQALRTDPGTKIVISSAWGEDKVIKRLEELGAHFIATHIIGRTPRISHDRGEQIQDWINANEDTDNYVVLEDEISDLFPYLDPEYVVEVDMNEGLSNKNTIDAVRKLNKVPDTTGNVVELTKENFDYYTSIGCTPSVRFDYDKDKDKWTSFVVDTTTLTLHMKKDT